MAALANVRHFGYKIFRTKTVTDEFLDTELRRCLNTFDITLLGIGHMIGAGIYVLTGTIARNLAGPGIILSFLLAGFASLLSALCYAEFGARVPKAGSAYTYTYVTVGELWAFVIGWNIILEHMLGAAAVARSWSGYLDTLFGHLFKNETIEYVGDFENSFFGDYPDIIAFLIIAVVCCFMGYGAKASTNFNTTFTMINMGVISFVIVYGLINANSDNWSAEHGGFLPYGTKGIFAGAASCFFAYIGFDGIATSGEEAANPAKSIPIATLISMSIVTFAYILMASALTLMVPYNLIHPTAAFADAFEQVGANWAKYVVAVGALSGMTTSLVGSLFALPRCVYAMANDGLIFRSLGYVHEKSQTPIVAVAVFGGTTAIIAMLFDVETLVQFLSIGTLMAYTIVSSSVIILRYQPGLITNTDGNDNAVSSTENDRSGLVAEDSAGQLKTQFRGFGRLQNLCDRFDPGSMVAGSVFAMIFLMFIIGAIVNYGDAGTWHCILPLILLSTGVIICLLLIYAHEPSRISLRFRVPLVPLLPCTSIAVNVILMMHLAPITWVRLVIWLAVGLLVYLFYGVRHSTENNLVKREYSNLITMTKSESGGTATAEVVMPRIEGPNPNTAAP